MPGSRNRKTNEGSQRPSVKRNSQEIGRSCADERNPVQQKDAGGGVSLMIVDAYRTATMAEKKTDHPEVTVALSEFERQLADSLLRVVVRGKKGRGACSVCY